MEIDKKEFKNTINCTVLWKSKVKEFLPSTDSDEWTLTQPVTLIFHRIQELSFMIILYESPYVLY